MADKPKKNNSRASTLGRELQALRKTHGAGPGRPRTVMHDAKATRCLCVDCRKARGHYPLP